MSVKPRKLPLRMCLGCKQSKPKKELVRVVRSPGGEICLDVTGKKSGRGAYLCGKKSCLQLARKAKRLERSLDCEIPQEVYAKLEEEIAKNEASGINNLGNMPKGGDAGDGV